LEQILVYATNHSESIKIYLILKGITDILFSISALVEMMTFFLVVKLMLPITPSEKEKRSEFQRFLFKGFAD
jgi:hypothetical protein